MNQDQETELKDAEAGQPETFDIVEEAPLEETPEAPAYSGKTPGEMLREGRERRELTIEDVVIQTRMSLETVRALEEDRDPPQNAWVYVRGYYRKYARALGLSENEILDAHERFVGGAPAPEPISTEWAPADVSPRGGVPRIVIVLIGGILLGGLAWWLAPQITQAMKNDEAAEKAPVERQTSGGTGFTIKRAPAAAAPASPLSEKAAPADMAPPATEEVPESDSRDSESVEEAAEPAGETGIAETDTAEAGEAEAGEAEASAAPLENQLLLQFTERSWVNVVDASGKKLLDGIVQAGSERKLAGQPPYRIFLGYGPGVAVSYAGSLVDTQPYTSGNNTARFTVGAETPANP